MLECMDGRDACSKRLISLIEETIVSRLDLNGKESRGGRDPSAT